MSGGDWGHMGCQTQWPRWPQDSGAPIHSTHHLPPHPAPASKHLLCRRLLSIRGVNDVLLSKGFLNPVYLPPTHVVHKGGETEGEQEGREFWYFPTQGRCHEVSIEFRFHRSPCPLVSHRREGALFKSLARPLQFPLSTQRDLGMGLTEKKKKRKRNGEGERGGAR